MQPLIKCAIVLLPSLQLLGRWLITVVKGGHNLMKYRKCITNGDCLAMSHSVKVLARGS